MIKFFKGLFGFNQESVVERNLVEKETDEELNTSAELDKAELEVLDYSNLVKGRAAKVADAALSLTGFYLNNGTTEVIQQHNGVISVTSAQCLYFANSYLESKELITGNRSVSPYLNDLFTSEVDRLMAGKGYYPTDAVQIFRVDPTCSYNHHAVHGSQTTGYVEFVLSRNYVKEGVDLILKGIAAYKLDFEAAKANMMKKHFTNRFRPVIECLNDLYLKSITDLPATNYNPMDRSGLLTVPLGQHFEDIGLSTELSLGRFRYTTDRFEVDYYLNDQDEEFIYTVHDLRAVVSFLWEALDPIVKVGKLNVSVDQRGGDARYTISVSF
ncbi:hypothetical protein [Serratia phage BUCT660]|nr:hypothetical protein [Serratia phage BUCT660]